VAPRLARGQGLLLVRALRALALGREPWRRNRGQRNKVRAYDRKPSRICGAPAKRARHLPPLRRVSRSSANDSCSDISPCHWREPDVAAALATLDQHLLFSQQPFGVADARRLLLPSGTPLAVTRGR